MDAPPSSNFNSPQRRSQRVLLKTPVVVLMRGDNNQRVAEHTRTNTVNAHGAMIVTELKLSVGQMLTLRNSRSQEEVLCRVAYLGFREGDKQEVGVGFMEPHPHFWMIPFPSVDWNPDNPT